MDAKKLEVLRAMGQPSDLWAEERLVRALFYGDFGAGKTTLAAKIAQVIGGKVALITTDSAWTVMHNYPDLAKNVIRYPFDSFGQVKLMVEAHMEGIEPFGEIKTFIWDTISTSIDRVLRDLVKRKKFINQQVDPDIEGYPHYRMVANGLKEVVELFNKSDLNVIYTAHVKFPSEADRKNQKFAIRPTANEMAYQVFGQEVQLIGWLSRESQSAQRKIQFKGTVAETAKSQISTIPEDTYLVDQIPELIQKWINN